MDNIRWQIVGMSVRCFRLRSSKIGVDLRRSMSTFEDRRSMCRPSRIDDRCVDLRRNNHIDHPSKMDDRCADLRRSMAVVSTLKTDDRCEIMLLHLLKTLMV